MTFVKVQRFYLRILFLQELGSMSGRKKQIVEVFALKWIWAWSCFHFLCAFSQKLLNGNFVLCLLDSFNIQHFYWVLPIFELFCHHLPWTFIQFLDINTLNNHNFLKTRLFSSSITMPFPLLIHTIILPILWLYFLSMNGTIPFIEFLLIFHQLLALKFVRLSLL